MKGSLDVYFCKKVCCVSITLIIGLCTHYERIIKVSMDKNGCHLSHGTRGFLKL